MRRWLHWQFVVPRVLLVVVILLAAQYVLGLVVRSMAIRAVGRAVGAHVAIGHARVSLADRQIVLSDVQFTNRHHHADGMLQADRCELNFDLGPLAHKRLVVESGRISGLRFNTSDGRVDSKEGANPVAQPRAWFKDDADLAAYQWLDSLNEHFTLDMVNQLDSVERTEAFCANWSKQSAELESRLRELDARETKLQEAIEAAQVNPLRNDDALEKLRKDAVALQKEFAVFQADVDKLPDELDAERRAIVAARQHDGDLVNTRLRLEPVEARALNAYLLREQSARQLDELIGWLRWIREEVPASATSKAGKRRGEDILFAGCRRAPGVLIRSLQLEGAVRIGGQPVELRGVLTSLASAPRFHDQPMRIHLVGRGSMPLELQVTIDRTGPVARDELLVDCRDVLLPSAALGRTEQLEMKLAPSVGSLSVSVVVEGEKLTGDIQMVQQKVQITPAVHGPAGPALCSAMGETLGVSSIATRLSLDGTLNKPACALWSNLGAAVAESMRHALRRAGDQHARELLAEAGRRVDERLAEVDRQMAELQRRLASKTTDLTARLDELATVEKPLYRISAKEGGRRLPKDSLFR
jgi:uncharacterized protein (TIGR03545 family)